MPRLTLPRVAVLAGLVVLAFGAAKWVVPWLTTSRTLVSSVPGTPPLTTPTYVHLRPGDRACATNVPINHDAGQVQVLGIAGRKTRPPLVVTASGPGYRATGRAPGAGTGLAPMTAAIAGPSRDLIGQVCLRNAGRVRLDLFGTREGRTNGRQQLVVRGRPSQTDVAMTLYQAHATTYLGSLGTIFDRAAKLKLGFLRGWMLWPLALALFLGIPAVPLWALWRTLREDLVS